MSVQDTETRGDKNSSQADKCVFDSPVSAPDLVGSTLSEDGTPHRPSWHSWRDASTCGARSPASLSWIKTASPSWLRL